MAVENVGSALCCAERWKVMFCTEQCQAAGSSWGSCSPCLTCCAVCTPWEPTSVSGQREEGKGEQLLTVVSGWISLLWKGSPGLVLHQWGSVVPITIHWNRTPPNLFLSMEYLNHLGSKIIITLLWHRTCHLLWSARYETRANGAAPLPSAMVHMEPRPRRFMSARHCQDWGSSWPTSRRSAGALRTLLK